MHSPAIAVIVPVYHGAAYLAETIESVLGQTFSDFELVIVNDASPDKSADVVSQFDDPRIIYVQHEQNRGANAARNTGIRASSAGILAFLDQDDLFHPEKLRMHVKFLTENPEIGVSYNSHFGLNHSSGAIFGLSRPPRTLTLSDLVVGFPFAPSDMVVRREWISKVGFWDERYMFAGADLDLNCRLALEGCRFARVDRALNHRRRRWGRVAGLATRCAGELRAQETVFDDPHCPYEVLALRDSALANTYLVYSHLALAQGETTLAHPFMRELVRLDPSVLTGRPCRLVEFLTTYSSLEDDTDHEVLLAEMFNNLPGEHAFISEQQPWAIQRGHILKGMRNVIWGRETAGESHFRQAKALGAELDENLLRKLVHQILDYEAEFGASDAQLVLDRLSPHLQTLGGRSSVRWLEGCYSVNRAFASHDRGDYSGVVCMVTRAISRDPKYLANRGVLSVLARSTVGRWFSLAI